MRHNVIYTNIFTCDQTFKFTYRIYIYIHAYVCIHTYILAYIHTYIYMYGYMTSRIPPACGGYYMPYHYTCCRDEGAHQQAHVWTSLHTFICVTHTGTCALSHAHWHLYTFHLYPGHFLIDVVKGAVSSYVYVCLQVFFHVRSRKYTAEFPYNLLSTAIAQPANKRFTHIPVRSWWKMFIVHVVPLLAGTDMIVSVLRYSTFVWRSGVIHTTIFSLMSFSWRKAI